VNRRTLLTAGAGLATLPLMLPRGAAAQVNQITGAGAATQYEYTCISIPSIIRPPPVSVYDYWKFWTSSRK